MRTHKHLSRVQIDVLERRTLLAAGDPDNTFGTTGQSVADFTGGFLEHAEGVAVQADGKTVVVGSVSKGDVMHFAVARFGLDGKLDPSFGPSSNGRIVTPIGGDNRAFAKCVLIMPDGRIVVGGSAKVVERFAFDDFEMTVARYHPSGQLDNSFGGDGIIANKMFGEAAVTDMALLPDGRLLAVGTGYDFLDGVRINVMRLRTNGSADSTFGTPVPNFPRRSGAIFYGGPSLIPSAVLLDEAGGAGANPNYGKILIGGSSSRGGFVMRLRTNGTIDKTFDGDGRLDLLPTGRTTFEIFDMLQLADRSILLAGTSNGDAVLARISADGVLDTAFGPDGTGFVIVDLGASDDAFTGLIASGSDHVIASGVRNGQFAAAKFQNNGQLDATFGTSGIIRPSFGSELTTTMAGPIFSWEKVAIAQGPGKRFVMAGGLGFGTARYLDKGANVVTAGTFNQHIAEGGATRSFIVGRLERLPTPTRVFFNLGGTASSPAGLPGQRDYTLSGMTVPLGRIGGGPAFVDIPANQTFTTVEITAVNDTRVEGFENATFTIIPDPSYELGHPISAEFFIEDNDGLSLKAVKDAFVRDGASSDTNFGTSRELQVKRFVNQPGFNRRSYLEFDLSSATTISSARLRMFGNLSSTAESNIPIDVFGTDLAPWSETTITFNNRPAIVGSALARATVIDDQGRWVEWDLTSFIQAQKAAGRSRVTLVLNAAVVSIPNVSFVSKEGGVFKPELLIS
jgi:uncharacterized delta-60 repeat protein